MQVENPSKYPTITEQNKLPYLSPSSIKQYHDSIEEFFLRYVVRVPRALQSKPMALGSAFDACIKAYFESWGDAWGYKKECHNTLYDKNFEAMVEPHNRDWAYDRGKIVFNMYRQSGALNYITSDAEPGSLRTLDTVEKIVDGVPLLGKPDLLWISRAYGCKIVDDWKCNGACSIHNKSPTPGFIDMYPSRSMHKACQLVNGVNVLDIHKDYELQLVIYSFLTDAEIVGINQLVFGASAPDIFGDLRVALHRHRISLKLKMKVLLMMHTVWTCISDYKVGGPFGSITASRCEQLIKQGEILKDPIERMLAGRG